MYSLHISNEDVCVFDMFHWEPCSICLWAMGSRQQNINILHKDERYLNWMKVVAYAFSLRFLPLEGVTELSMEMTTKQLWSI